MNLSADQLRLFIERIERIEEDQKGLADDKRDVYAEAKSTGFDVKALRTVIKRRAADRAALQEQDALVELYEGAVGL